MNSKFKKILLLMMSIYIFSGCSFDAKLTAISTLTSINASDVSVNNENVTSFKVNGNCKNLGKVTLTVTRSDISKNAKCDGFRYSFDLDLSSVDDGEHLIKIETENSSEEVSFIKDVTPPSLEITSSFESAPLYQDSTKQISWTSVDSGSGLIDNPIKIEYSNDNGTTWVTIADNLANTGTYNWTVPHALITQGRLKISSTDLFENTKETISDIFSSTSYFVEMKTANSGYKKFATASVSSRNSNLMAVEEFDGLFYKSVDGGLTWTKLCRNPFGATYYNNINLGGQIVFSKGAEDNIYLVTWGAVIRADSLNGANCPQLSSYSPYVLGTYYFRNLDTDSAGNVYVQDWGNAVYKSSDYGNTFNILATAAGQYGNNVYVDPFNSNNILISGAANNTNIMKVIVPGTTFAEVSTGTITSNNYLSFDPAHAGYIYSNAGIYSSDSGATWQTDSNYNPINMQAFYIRKDGSSLRVKSVSNQLIIEKTLNLQTPLWTSLLAAGLTISTASLNLMGNVVISAEGTNIALLVENDLYLSRDSGASFSKLAISDSSPVSLPIVASSDGLLLYGANRKGEIYKSVDAGSSWNLTASTTDNIFSGGTLMGFAHPNQPQSMLFRNISTGNYYEGYAITTNGFTTTRFSSPSVTSTPFWAWTSAVAQNPFSAGSLFAFGVNNSNSLDYGANWNSLVGTFECCDAYHAVAVPDISNPSKIWYLAPSQYISSFDGDSGAKIQINNLPFVPVDWEYYANGATLVLKMMGSDGSISTTTDGFQTYTVVSNSFSGCSKMASLASDRNNIALVCSDILKTSSDGGVTWQDINLLESPVATCDSGNNCWVNITQITMTATGIYMSDGDQKTFKYVYP